MVVIPACAGMEGLNHWIPACAGMTEGLKSGICQTWQKGLSGWQQTHADPPSSFQRKLESSGLLHTFPPGGNDHLWVIPASVIRAIRLTPCLQQAGPARLPGFRPAPACCRQAGMTEGLKSGICQTWQKGLSGWQQTHAEPPLSFQRKLAYRGVRLHGFRM